jgi:hypothetical protein
MSTVPAGVLTTRTTVYILAAPTPLKLTATLVAVLKTAFFFLIFRAGDPTAKLARGIVKGEGLTLDLGEIERRRSMDTVF